MKFFPEASLARQSDFHWIASVAGHDIYVSSSTQPDSPYRYAMVGAPDTAGHWVSIKGVHGPGVFHPEISPWCIAHHNLSS